MPLQREDQKVFSIQKHPTDAQFELHLLETGFVRALK
jgi:hypothetical protein